MPPSAGRADLLFLLSDQDESAYLKKPNGDRWYYGTNQRISRIVTTRGLTTRFVYDATVATRLTEVYDGYGRKVSFEYEDDKLRRIRHPDSPDVVTEIGYENTEFPNRLSWIKDPEGHTTSFEYTEAEIEFQNSTYTYHRIARETLKNDVAFTCEYGDAQDPEDGRVFRKILAEKPLAEGGSALEPVLEIRAKTFPLHHDHRAAYDVEDNRILLTDGRGQEWEYFRNHYGQLTQRKSPSDSEGSFYNNIDRELDHDHPSLGRPVLHVDELGTKRSYTWVDGERPRSVHVEVPAGSGHCNPAMINYLTTWWYATDEDALEPGDDPLEPYYANLYGLPLKKQEPSGGKWHYRYNDKGDVTSIKDPLGHPETYAYTYYPYDDFLPQGLPSGFTLPGRLHTVTKTDRRGFVTEWTYDHAGGLEQRKVYLDLAQTEHLLTEYAHDAAGRRTRESVLRAENDFFTTEHEYDLMGRATRIVENPVEDGTNPHEENLTTAFQYDPHGLLETVTNPNDVVTRYAYDHRNRLVAVIEDDEGLQLKTSYELDGNGNITRKIDPMQRETLYSDYSPFDHVRLVEDAEGYKTRYERDPMGNILTMERTRVSGEEPQWETVETRTYDGLSRLQTRKHAYFPTVCYDYEHPSGSPSGCGCSGLGSNIPYRIRDNATPPSVTYQKVDELGRLRRVVRKFEEGAPQSGHDDDPEPDGDDAFVEHDYDEEGNLVEIRGAEGELTELAYDGAGRLTTRNQVLNEYETYVTQYFHDGADNLTRVIAPHGHETTYEYDGVGRRKRAFDAFGEIAAFAYDAGGNLVSRKDALGHEWVFQYDALDRLRHVFDPLQEAEEDRMISLDYDAGGNLVSRANRNNVVTRYEYDDIDRLTRVIEDYDPDSPCGAVGPEQELDGEGEEGTQGQGTLQGGGPGSGGGVGNEASSFDTASTCTSYFHDGRHLTGIYDHDGNGTTYEHVLNPANDRLDVTITYPDDGTVHILDEPSVRTRTRTDQRDRDTIFVTDKLGRLSQRDFPSSVSAYPAVRDTFRYDRSDRLIEAVRAHRPLLNGGFEPVAAWGRLYDTFGRPVVEAQEYGSSSAYVTYADYHLDAQGHTLTQQICYPGCGSRIVERVWDGRGRLISANAGSDIGVDWEYDAADRRELATRRTSHSSYTDLVYDENDRLTRLTHFAYDGSSSPAEVVDESFGYDPEGNRRWKWDHLAASRSERYGHDDRGRLTTMERGELVVTTSGSGEIDPFLHHATLASKQDWVKLDRRGNWSEFREGHEVGGAGEKIRVETREANGANAYESVHPGYDGIGMLTPKGLVHDAAGNLTFNRWAKNVGDPCPLADGTVPIECKTGSDCNEDKVGCGLGQEYEYDGENRLVRIRRDTNNAAGPPSGSNAEPILMEFTYDALGRRIETVEYVDAATGCRWSTAAPGCEPQPRRMRHVYFGLEMIQEYQCGGPGSPSPACEQGGSGPVLVREFYWGDPERYPEVIAMQTFISTVSQDPEDPPVVEPWAAYHYLHDALGSVIGLVDEAGFLVERYTYDPYGKPFIEARSLTTGEYEPVAEEHSGMPYSAFGNPWMWTGQYYTAATGTYQFKERTYLPVLGRWAQRDPIEYEAGSVNLYEYVFSSPLNWVDPDGEAAVRIHPPSSTEIYAAIMEDHRQQCAALKRRILAIQKRIDRRVGQLKENPRALPETCPGDDKNPSLSRRGHRDLIDKDKALLARRISEYWSKCMDKNQHPTAPRLLPVTEPGDESELAPIPITPSMIDRAKSAIRHSVEVAKYLARQTYRDAIRAAKNAQCPRCKLIHP